MGSKAQEKRNERDSKSSYRQCKLAMMNAGVKCGCAAELWVLILPGTKLPQRLAHERAAPGRPSAKTF